MQATNATFLAFPATTNRSYTTVYKRGPDGWQVEFLEADGEISIPCLETTLKLEQVYAGLV
jgi:hypothetical protein